MVPFAGLLLALALVAGCGGGTDPADFPPVDDLRDELAAAQVAPALAPGEPGGRCREAASSRGALFLPAGSSLVLHAELPPEAALRVRARPCGGGEGGGSGRALSLRVSTDEAGSLAAELALAPAVQALRLPDRGGPARLELLSTGTAGAEAGLLLDELELGARPAASEPMPPPRLPARPNLVVYLIDALRRDALGSYGNSRPLSPHLDRLAAEGTLFADAVAQGSWTRPAVASLLTGLTPAAHGVLTKSDALSPAAETLAERLQAAGYRTLALVTNGNVSGKLGFRQGFAHMRQLLRGPEHSAIGVNAELERWLDATAADPRPFFAYLHVVEPHGPYTPPEPYRGRFADGVPFALGSRDSLRRLQTSATPPPAASVDGLRALYDAEVAEVDAAFGALRAALEQRGLWGSTAVVVLADHGEEFLEHDGWEHGNSLHAEMIDIPLLVRVPGLGAGRRVAGLAQQVDLLPTLLALAGEAPPTGIDGRSLLPAIAGGELPPVPARSYQRLGGFVRHGTTSGSEVAVTSAGHRLILRLGDDGSVVRRLYDRRRDPREQRDLHAQRPITTAWLESVLRWPPRGGGSLAQPAEPLEPEVEEQLRALGYVQ